MADIDIILRCLKSDLKAALGDKMGDLISSAPAPGVTLQSTLMSIC